MFRINPAFDRFPREAHFVGRILACFGEIEFSVCRNAGHASGMPDDAIPKALYRLRATSSRLDAADAIMRPVFALNGLIDEYRIADAGIGHCVRLRNQYAHCNWADNETEGLFFADLQGAAGAEIGFELSFRHVDVPLLESQYAFFAYVMEWLSFLDIELGVRTKRLSTLSWPRPLELSPPPLHNPPETHVPPWLTEDQKARHLARALAAKGGAPTPTPAQQALDRAREARRSRRQADRDRDLAKRSDPDSQQ
jgi:hypothetical protein